MPKQLITLILAGLASMLLFAAAGNANEQTISLDFSLTAPGDQASKTYLGLETDSPFLLSDVIIVMVTSG